MKPAWILFTLSLPAFGFAGESAVSSAIRDEIARSTTSLQMPGYPKPYYAGVRWDSGSQTSAHFAFGARIGLYRWDYSYAAADLRVGDYALDNHPVSAQQLNTGSSLVELPKEPDAKTVRQVLWLHLDALYKRAAQSYLNKQAQRVRSGQAEYDYDDFSREAPAHLAQGEPVAAPDTRDWSAPVARWAGRFLKPDILEAATQLNIQDNRMLFLDSESSVVEVPSRLASLSLFVKTLTPDGMPLLLRKSWIASSPELLMQNPAWAGAPEKLLLTLEQLRGASEGNPFVGPAILDPEISSLLLEILVSQFLAGEKVRDPEEGRFFLGRAGDKVFPDFMTLVDDPTRREAHGIPLAGAYRYDQQGRPARRVVLIENGVLKGYLLSRYPLRGFEHSNGHGRASIGNLAMARPGNLLFNFAKPISSKALKKRLILEAKKQGKASGLILEGFSDFDAQTQSDMHQSFRISADRVIEVDAKTGEERLLRNLDLVGTPLSLANRLLAAGMDEQVFNRLSTGLSGEVPISVLCPSLLFQELELQKSPHSP
ncbi:MAG: hypothetical protein HY611_08445, partial [Elusimicrobia bacterium]|nr:hypothetical protein [Elusimicrobiota bacterium]